MSIRIPIISEFDGKGIERARKEFANLETAGEKAGFLVKKAFLPATAALGALTAAAIPAINAASDLNEVMSKTAVIFDDASKEVIAFSETTAKSMGISQTAALNAASTFGVFGKSAGLTGQSLATFSTDFTKLAADLASFNNTTPEQAIQAIGAALRGESEPIRAYGVLLSDAVLKQEALNLGIYDGTGALTAQQKVLAAQAAIYKQTTDAQGDFARTSDGLANQQRILAASIDNLQASIGKALLPVVQAILPVVNRFADWAAKNPKAFLAIAGAIGAVATAVVAVNVAMMLNPFSAIAAGIALLVAGLVTAYNKFEWFRTGVNAMLNFMLGAFETFANSLIGAVNIIISGLNFIPGVNISTINPIKLPRIGSGGGGASLASIYAEREGNLPSGAAFAVPAAAIPSLAVGGGGGGGGGGSRVSVAPRGLTGLTTMTPAEIAQGNANADFFAGGLDNPRVRQEITVNVNGGLATSAEIGEAVVNSIRSFNTVHGPANIAVAV